MTLQTKVYNYTGAQQVFTVPADVTSVRFELWGAGAGNNHGFGVHTGFLDTNANAGGPLTTGHQITGAGYVAGTLAVTAGQTFFLYVGGNGYNGDEDSTGYPSGKVTLKGGTGGWNGGGNGGGAVYNELVNAESEEAAAAGGGGGATDVRLGGVALSNRLFVAGGAGAAGANYFGKYAYYGSNFAVTWGVNPSTPSPPFAVSPTTYYPSAGNGIGGWGGSYASRNGGNAASVTGGAGAGSGGKGGTVSGGGAGGSAFGASGVAGSAGALGVGGNGAAGTQSTSNNAASMAGGGGGGGYYGGGGGALGYFGFSAGGVAGFGGGGGGGADFVTGTATNTVDLGHAYPPAAAGATGAGGFLRITYNQPPDPPTITAPTNFSSVAVNQAIVVTWTFSSPDLAATPTAADIQWKTTGGSTWTLTHQAMTTMTGTYTFPANFFTTGTSYNIQVRVYDNNNDVSAWAQATISVVTVPAAPVITTPAAGAQVTSNSFSLIWTNPSGSPELVYEVAIADQHGITVVDTGVVQAATRLNLAQNPSFETGVANWTAVGGSIATSTTFAAIGTQSGKVTWAASTNAYVYQPIPTQPGLTYTILAKVALGTPGTDPQITLGAQNPTDTAPFATGAPSVMSVGGSFYTVTMSFIAQQSTTWLVFTPGTGTTTAGQITYIDKVLAEINSTGVPLIYFDGSNLNGNTGTVSWTGTVGNSYSQLLNADTLTLPITWTQVSQPVTASVRYATVASQGVFSAWTTRAFSINVTPPGTPTVVLTADNNAGTVSLAITAVDVPTATTYCDVFRTDITHGGAEIRIATHLIPDPSTRKVTFVDRTAGGFTLYAYRVRSYSAGLGYADAT